jgi:uncharacterized membrane protein YhaH (DUF805 family)
MQALNFLFSPSGRLRPRAFVIAAIAVYAAGVAAQWLTTPLVILRAGLWPFAAAQAALIWIWYAVHARRLHDADRPAGLAMAAALLYALAIILLLIVAIAFFKAFVSGPTDTNATGALGLILFVSVIALLAGSSSYDIGWFIVALLVLLACTPAIIAIVVTLWAATRPSVEKANLEKK